MGRGVTLASHVLSSVSVNRSPSRIARLARSPFLRQLGQAIVVALGVVIITFLLVRIAKGDASSAVIGTRGSEEAREAVRAELNLDQSLPSQFSSYLGGVLQGDLGNSLVQQGRPVSEIIADTLPVTMSLIALTVAIACLLGIPLGLLAALAPWRGTDVGIRGLLSVLIASPPFFLGLLLILGPALAWGLFPAGGWGTGWPANLEFLVLPAVALSGYLTPLIARAVRQAALEAKNEAWYEAALARGAPARLLTIHHVLPNSLLPVVTLIGINVGALVAGAVVVESVFGLPGIGQELITAVQQRDYTLIQGIALVTALLVVFANLIADCLYRVVDPRTRRA
jgi:peptide/nickel transport system permease protein